MLLLLLLLLLRYAQAPINKFLPANTPLAAPMLHSSEQLHAALVWPLGMHCCTSLVPAEEHEAREVLMLLFVLLLLLHDMLPLCCMLMLCLRSLTIINMILGVGPTLTYRLCLIFHTHQHLGCASQGVQRRASCL
jgi:hypothetical protein